MSDRPVTITALLGSVTAPGRLRRAVAEALARVDPARARSQLLDLAELSVPFADGRRPEGDTARVIGAIADAEAVLLATPIYRGSCTGALKNLLDHVPVPALRDTPVAIVAMGATDHHHLGAERHLRDVLAFFGALVVPTASYLTGADFADGVAGARAAGELDAELASLISLAAGRRAVSEPLGPAPLVTRFRAPA